MNVQIENDIGKAFAKKTRDDNRGTIADATIKAIAELAQVTPQEVRDYLLSL